MERKKVRLGPAVTMRDEKYRRSEKRNVTVSGPPLPYSFGGRQTVLSRYHPDHTIVVVGGWLPSAHRDAQRYACDEAFGHCHGCGVLRAVLASRSPSPLKLTGWCVLDGG